MKEIKDYTNRWRDMPCSWIGRINIVKMTLLPTAIYTFNEIPAQIASGIFHRTRTEHFTLCMEAQKTPNSQSNLESEKWSWREYSNSTEESKFHHNASHQEERSKHFCPLHLGIGIAKENTTQSSTGWKNALNKEEKSQSKISTNSVHKFLHG